MFKTVEQAGAITFRMNGRVPEFLLVRAKKNPEHWIFPKGHTEAGEESADAALRELREEAGALAEVVQSLGAIQYRSGTETFRVQYYLCRFKRQIDEGDGRARQWCRFERAADLLSFQDLRELTSTAVDVLRQLGPGPQ
jgi:bis(5'-nucleosidyl)-tetraphosphatase